MQKKEVHYKHCYVGSVQIQPNFDWHYWVFVDKPQLGNCKNTANEMARARYHKLQPHKADYFCNVKVHSRTAVIDKYIFCTTMCIHRITAALGRKARTTYHDPATLSRATYYRW